MAKHLESSDIKVIRRIHAHKRGWTFTLDSFKDLGSRSAIDHALARYVENGTVRKLARGLYDYLYLNGNPFKGNTYRRLHEGDRPCSDEIVKRMLAEQVEESRDTRILTGFSLADLDQESLHAYRNMLATHRPDHPWLALDDQHFLQVLGGFRHDRQTEEEGLTLAGLLMFGQWPALQEAVPYYFADYQEQPEDKTSQTRWLDRVVPDGSWSGNLFDFFRKVSRKLVVDLKVPFVLKGNFRQDDTPLHRALREALVNTLVHADYSDRASILVVKDPAGFLFRNPGLMRVPVEQALQGGESDCRNRTLHQMFLMINLGERAGSGLPKIRQGWEMTGGNLNLLVPYRLFSCFFCKNLICLKVLIPAYFPFTGVRYF